MRTRFAAVIIIFLGLTVADTALTVPGYTDQGPTATATSSIEADLARANLTVLLKNRDFPLKIRMTMEPCALAACVEI